MADELLRRALEELKNLRPNEEFLVKDLFRGYEWKRTPLPERLRLGVLFLHAVTSGAENKIKLLDKTSSNQQKYMKIS